MKASIRSQVLLLCVVGICDFVIPEGKQKFLGRQAEMRAKRLAEGVIRGKAQVERDCLDRSTRLKLFHGKVHTARVEILPWSAAEGTKK